MPVVLDPRVEAAVKRIYERLDALYAEDVPAGRVRSLVADNPAVNGRLVETVGAPTYVTEDDLDDYDDYGLTESGWYAFARIAAKPGNAVASGFSVTGAHAKTPIVGDTHCDVAVKFGVAAETVPVTVNWGGESETFYFKATDLAVRNMDYRVTFYQYDLSPYCTYTWAVASGTFAAGKGYYTRSGEEGSYVYTRATVTTGQSIPANTYYTHSAMTISGFVKNISYMLPEIDCPVTIVLPGVEENYGAWFEVQTKYLAAYSLTLTPATGDLVSGALVHSPKAGVDIINLMYHKPTKTWLPTITNFETGV